MSQLKERIDRLMLSRTVQPVRHNPPGKVLIDATVAFNLCEVWTKVYSPEAGSGLTFPQTVQCLSELGVTRYRVDFVTNTTIAYIGGSAHLYHFPSYATEDITPGSIPWSHSKLRAAIKKAREDAKNMKPDLPTYTRQIVEAGVCDYTCFIEGRRVIYTGFLGEQHSAWFMGAGPEAPINTGLVRRNTATGHAYASRPTAGQIASSPLRDNVNVTDDNGASATSEGRRPSQVEGSTAPIGANSAAEDSPPPSSNHAFRNIPRFHAESSQVNASSIPSVPHRAHPLISPPPTPLNQLSTETITNSRPYIFSRMHPSGLNTNSRQCEVCKGTGWN